MRMMNLPQMPRVPASAEDCLTLYAARLAIGEMVNPLVSQMLVAFAAWPNDEPARNSWIATNLARFVERFGHQSSAEIPKNSMVRAFNAFGGFGTVATAAWAHQMRVLEPLNKRWPPAADVLQSVVDIGHEDRLKAVGGGAVFQKRLHSLRKIWGANHPDAHNLKTPGASFAMPPIS